MTIIHRSESHIEVVAGADPAAGSEVTFTVPANEHWLVQSLGFTLVTAITAATREVTLRITDGTNQLAAVVAATTQIASLTKDYVFTVGGTLISDQARPGENNIIGASLPPLVLPPASVIETLTVAIQAGDNFGIPHLLVEKFR